MNKPVYTKDIVVSGAMEHRGYAVLDVKKVSEEQRIIEGIATSPEPDRMGDIIEPLGVQFKNPIPLLWQHMSSQPIGTARLAKPTEEGIRFVAQIARTDEPGTLKDRLDEAWQTIKLGLVRGVSIGFRSIERSFMDDGGIRFLKTEVLELSAVTIPANSDASIHTIKAIDAASRKIDGDDKRVVQPPGGTGISKPNSAPKGAKAMTKSMTIAEQISAFEAKRAANAARMAEMMNKAAEGAETLDGAESEEYDGLAINVKKIDEHLKRLHEQEELNKAAAVPVAPPPSSIVVPDARHEPRISVKANVPVGTAFIRHLCARYQAQLNHCSPIDICRKYPHWHNTPEVEASFRAAVAAGTTTGTTWAAPLVELQNLTSEFAEYLRAASIIGRIPGITRVPFNIKVPRQTGTSTVNWVGEGKVKPLSALAFDQIEMRHTKVAGIVVVTEELLRFSNPAVEQIIRTDLSNSITALVDRDFLDPTKAEAAAVSPASITYNVTPITASGTTADAFRADFADLLAEFSADNMSLGSLVLVMTTTQAMRLAFLVNTLGQDEFPDLTPTGGTIRGIPVITSENILATGNSPADGYPIIAINAREILLADDGGVTVDVSREASVQMEDAPDSPPTASTTLVSLWQHDMVGLRAERFINWKKRRSEAVAYIQNAKYGS